MADPFDPSDSVETMKAYLAAVVESSDDAIIGKTLDGIITTWNRGAEKMFGYTAQEIVGRPVSILIPPEKGAEERLILDRLQAGERIEQYDTVRIRKDGRPIHVSLTVSPIVDQEGRVVGASKVARDITEKKAYEKDLFEQSEELRVILANIGDGVIVCDLEEKVVFLNKAAEVLTGWTAADAKEERLENVFRIVNEKNRRPAFNPVRRVLQEGKTVELANHTVLIARNGIERAIDDSAAPIVDNQGELRGVVFVFRDVTERRAAEENRARLAAIVDSSEDAIISKDLSGRITTWNGAAQRLFGYTPQEIIGKHISLLIPPSRLLEEPAILEKIRKGERVAHFETERLAKDGRKIEISLTISPIRDSSGEIIGASKIARDITERKRLDLALSDAQKQLSNYAGELERQVAERTRQLRETIEELEAFSFTVSHDLRAPLRAMQGFAEAFLEDFGHKLAPPELGYIERIVTAGQRLDRLIEDVLQYSRIGRTEFHVGHVDLDRLVGQVIEQYPNLSRNREHITIERPLGSVLGHEPSLVQCISNLLSNAIKFVRPNTAPEVRVHTEPLGANIRLVVADSGIGIAPEYQKQIFSIFERLHGQEEYEGTGIGLSIVQKAVHRMGGRTGVESKPGEGSRFWIELPAGE